MAIGTPTSLGTNSQTTGGGKSNVTLTTTAAITAGNLVVVTVFVGSTPGGPVSVSTVSDGTNTYSRAIGPFTFGGTDNFEMWYVANAAAVSSGATITATFASTVTGGAGQGQDISACQVSGIVTSSPVDKTGTASTSTTTPSISTGTLSQAVEIIFTGAINLGGNSYTESTGFTTLNSFTDAAGQTNRLSYDIVSATTSVTYQPTWSSTSVNGELLATFKGSVPVSETNTHFIGKHTPSQHKVTGDQLYQLQSDGNSSNLPALQGSAEQLSVIAWDAFNTRYSRFNYEMMPDGASSLSPQPETNVHFIGKFNPYNFKLFRYEWESDGSSSLSVQPETNPHFIGKFTPPSFYRFRYEQMPDGASSLAPQPETNVHFIGKYTAPTFQPLRALCQNQAEDTGFVVVETNISFIASFTQPKFNRFNYNQVPDVTGPLGTQPETNTNFIAKFTSSVFQPLRYLWETQSLDITQTQPETNVHFIGKYKPYTFNRFPYQWQSDGTSAGTPENQGSAEQLFIIAWDAFNPKYNFRYERSDTDPTSIVPETNVHFIGKFNTGKFYLLSNLRHNPDLSQSTLLAQPDTYQQEIQRRPNFTPKFIKIYNPTTGFNSSTPPAITTLYQVGLIGSHAVFGNIGEQWVLPS